MAFIPTPNTVRISIEFTFHGVVCVITLWFEFAAPVGVDQLDTIGGRIATWLEDELMPHLSEDISATGVRVTAQDSDSAPSTLFPISPPIAGGASGDVQAEQVAAVVTFRTAFRGRSFRGRNYIPGQPSAGILSTGLLDPAQITAFLDAYEALADVETDLDATHVVVSHFTEGGPRASGLTTPVSSYTMDQNLDTQRRRAQGRGV